MTFSKRDCRAVDIDPGLTGSFNVNAQARPGSGR
jgi:hypothetical protein